MYFCFVLIYFFFFKQKTAYEMRISDWSSDVCSSDLIPDHGERRAGRDPCGPHPCAAGRGRAHRGGRRRDRRGGRKRGGGEIGRASCRERVCQYVWISVVAVALKKKKQ